MFYIIDVVGQHDLDVGDRDAGYISHLISYTGEIKETTKQELQDFINLMYVKYTDTYDDFIREEYKIYSSKLDSLGDKYYDFEKQEYNGEYSEISNKFEDFKKSFPWNSIEEYIQANNKYITFHKFGVLYAVEPSNLEDRDGY